MTLALYGKTRRRQVWLLAIALMAVFAATMFAVEGNTPAEADHAGVAPDAADYLMFAKAEFTGTSDPEARELVCSNGSNDRQAETSGQTSIFGGRIHSN